MIRIGTSGWNYPRGAGTWNGVFYPKPRPTGFDELRFYSEHFDTVEVNSTFYGQPRADITRQWHEKTPEGFDFALKLFQKFTHPRMFRERELAKAPGADNLLLDWLVAVTQSDIDQFRAGIEPLAVAGKVGALLAQFPASFRFDSRSVDYLDALLRAFSEYPVAVELRHKSWSDTPETIALLNAHGALFVQIDEPKFKTSIRQNLLPTLETGYYMRLHGRNAKQWWRHDDRDERYNYLYSVAELQPFAETLTAVDAIVKHDARAYMNNHHSAKGVINAAMLQELLGIPAQGEYPEDLRAQIGARVP